MTKEEKLKEATRLIQGLVPDIMTVQAGCVLVSKFSLQIECIYSCVDDIVHLFGHVEYDLIIDSIYRDYHVLGRRIELQDVLSTLSKYNVSLDYGVGFSDDDYISLSLWKDWIEADSTTKYDFNKPFTEQSEEFYNFIIDTLK